MNIIIVRPPAEVRIPRRTAARANFVVLNKGARKFYLISNTNTYTKLISNAEFWMTLSNGLLL